MNIVYKLKIYFNFSFKNFFLKKLFNLLKYFIFKDFKSYQISQYCKNCYKEHKQ